MTFDPSALKVLVFDPRLDTRTALRGLVERIGVREVRLAADQAEALRRLRDDRVDAILLDDETPTAAAFVQTLRRQARGPVQETPIVLVVRPEAAAIQAARDAGVNELVARPAVAAALRERLEEIVEHPRRFIRSAAYVGPCRRRRKPKMPDDGERRTTPAAARFVASHVRAG